MWGMGLFEKHKMPLMLIMLLLAGQTTLRCPSVRSSWYPSLGQPQDVPGGDTLQNPGLIQTSISENPTQKDALKS